MITTMKRYLLVLIACCVLCINGLSQTVGLVLSGGGAKGIAHIGVIQAMEDNNIPIDYVAGTSMGAIVGALYAMGYTPSEMIALIKSDDFLSWQKGKIDEKYIYYFKKPDPTPEIVSFKIGIKDSTKIMPHFLPNSLINPLPMNLAFMRIFAPYTAQAGGNFDNLFVPLRAVASDVYHKKPVIFKSGDLGDAVRASMSFPFVFKPIEIDGVLVYDGGIYDNFPTDIMKRDFNPDIIIGSVVAGNPEKPEEGNLMAQIENMIMQKSDYTIDEKDGILLKFDLKNVGLLDFNKADDIFSLGYEKTTDMIDSIKARIPREQSKEQLALQRLVFKSKTPPLVFDKVTVSGGNHAQNSYIKKQFQIDPAKKEMTEEEVKKSYFKLLSDSKISDLIPHAVYEDQSGKFDLMLKAKMSDNIVASLGGYLTSSNTSMIYIGAHYRTLSLYSMDFDVNGYLGQSYNSALASARFELPSSIPMYLKIMGVYSHKRYYENDKLFYVDDSPTFISNTEAFGKIRMGLPFMTNSKTEISFGYGHLQDRYYQSNNVDYTQIQADLSRYRMLMGSLKFEKNTLNSIMYASSGSRISVTGEAAFGTEKYIQNPAKDEKTDTPEEFHSWLQLNFSSSHYLNLSKKFTLGIKGYAVISSKGFFNNYTSTLIQAPAFTPTPQSRNVFNEALRANQFVAAGILPIWHIIDNLQLRTEFYGFVPFFEIKRGENNKPYYGKFMDKFSYLAEMALVYNLQFASVGLYVNKYSYPSDNWNFGISFGIQMFNPKFFE